MESNSDKTMRDKLKGIEMPFDPAAWEQMEAMLDKKEKKRGFFWWWYAGGMAGLMLLTGAGAYMAMNGNEHTGNEQVAVNTVGISQQHEAGNSGEVSSKQNNAVSSDESTASSTLQNETGREESAGTSSAGINSAQQNAIGSKQLNEAGNKKNNTKLSSTRNHQPVTINGSAARNPQTAPRNATGTKRASALNAQLKTRNGGATRNSEATRNTQPATANPIVLTDFNGKPITATAYESTTAEPVYADKYWMTNLNTNSEEYNPAHSQSSDELPEKMRAKEFRYSLGVLANYSQNIVRKGIPGRDTSSGKNYATLPSYSIGFTHDLLFANRFAISNSILFSQSSFWVSGVRSEAFTPAPISFRCRMTEIAIPIGIKVYPVAKPKFKFYLSAGVINHIKLQETFRYASYAQPSNNFNDVKNTYPTQTSFNGSGNGAVESYDMNLNAGSSTMTSVSVNTNEFSINNAKRYYASFYAGAGVEGIIKNRWILFAEPSFNMTLQKIGIQERRKYNVGTNLGFRYQF